MANDCSQYAVNNLNTITVAKMQHISSLICIKPSISHSTCSAVNPTIPIVSLLFSKPPTACSGSHLALLQEAYFTKCFSYKTDLKIKHWESMHEALRQKQMQNENRKNLNLPYPCFFAVVCEKVD